MRLIIHPFLELLAALEKREPFGRDFNLVTGFRVPAHIAFVFLDMKTAKSPDFDPFSFDERFGERVEENLDYFRGIGFGQCGPVL